MSFAFYYNFPSSSNRNALKTTTAAAASTLLPKMKKHKGERKAADDPEIPYLPSEIIFNILSRLSTLTLIRCKRVCKAWLNLIKSDEFLKSHNPVPGLALKWGKSFKFLEFADEADLVYDEHLQKVAFDFQSDLLFDVPLHSSINGLLFMCERGFYRSDHVLCNPITREYIRLPSPPEPSSRPQSQSELEIYGFGVSRMSGQYKVVRISFDIELTASQPECQVYTVGSGSWRRIDCNTRLEYITNSVGAFLNGNLHWLVDDSEISCLDLETELFTTLSTPPNCYTYRTLSVLGDCLCVCHNSTNEIRIWLMKEYGDVKSWTKQFVIYKVDIYRDDFLGYVRPIKAFKDGSIIMELLGKIKILYYSSETKVIRQVGVPGSVCSTAIYSPTLLQRRM